ncbi:PREDICTED: fatty acid synthase-like [Wasmannia auropunctata]|uniref:fatty acid synthase-like n=1 Tax=Wasmannia auropunctata TaxID=64793 RepID=UPI0005EF69E3|nr:PREDICTED: fatty acid synthase-like [Wasmannia auropunctata]
MDDTEVCTSWNGIDSGEEIVISGIAGRFPDSDNVNQLRENLFNKIDLVRADHGRWEIEHPDLPNRMGTIRNMEKFDADFFGLSFHQAHVLSPEARMLLEHSYESIIDAGINPKRLRGKDTAVIIGTSFIESQEKFNECGISKLCLDYIEAHGTATKAGDPPEINAIYNVLCKNRENPLFIGSVKSNLGHAEPASGLAQIAKIVIAFETGFVPPNINYTSPRDDIDALKNGAVCVVKEPMALKNGYIGINSFGFGGGRNLLKFQVFANTIRICDDILKPYNINVTDILTNTKIEMCENALYAFVGIVAIQIGLVDFLTSLKITPDYVISHSAGELGCAYADGCLTIEQTILSAYFIGLTCAKGKLIHSSMAIINFGYECLKNICPIDIEIVCRNSENSSVVSGPTESMQEFMKKLQVNNIYVKEIHCNMPYHSSRLASVEPQLLFNLNKIIPRPKKRSPKWISTSIPRAEWHTLESKLSSADYHTRSILNTVLFEQASHLIPCNAITIEIASDGSLQQVIRESLHSEVTNIILTRHIEQNTHTILQGIGKLYNCGLQPQIADLYPPVKFPVSRGTPMISPLIRWDHSEDWYIPSYKTQKSMKSRERYVEILLNDEDYDYMDGHVIDGRNLLPAMGYLAIVWQTIGMIKGQMYTTIPIIFRDVKFIRATYLSRNDAVKLAIAIQKDGKFEITEGDSVVVTGMVYETSNPEQEMISIDSLPEDNNEEEHMTTRDIYKELKLRGYQYSGWFRGLKSASLSGSKGHIIWKNNWVTFMDNMLQMHIIGCDTRDLYVPTSIQKLVINPKLHALKLRNEANILEATTDKQLQIRVYKKLDTIRAGGIEIRGLKASQISRRKLAQDVIIEKHIFVAHCDRAKVSLNEAIRISAQLALEDHQVIKVKVIELVEDIDDVELEYLSSSLLVEAFNDMPLIQANLTLLTSPNRFNSLDVSQNISIVDLNKVSIDDKALIVAGFNLLTKQQTSLEKLMPFLREGSYLLTREKCDVIDYKKYLQQYDLNVILEKRTDKEMVVLLKKKVLIEKRIVVYVNNDNFNWLEDLKSLLSDENKKFDEKNRIIIVGEGDFECGLLGFVNCLRKEPGGELVRSVLIQDKEAPKFSLQNPFYVQQLQKDMTINVLRSNEIWGSYRHLRLPQPEAELVPTAHVCQTVRGDLSTFCWIENDRSVESSHEDLVYVVYSPLNFKDVMLATSRFVLNRGISHGRLFEYIPLGMEYVGFDASGQRVMGLLTGLYVLCSMYPCHHIPVDTVLLTKVLLETMGDIFDNECSSSSENELENITKCAKLAKLIPQKSKKYYNQAYQAYQTWLKSKNKINTDENVLLAYMAILATKNKPSTLWSTYSKLKTMLKLNDGIDITSFTALTQFLKSKNKGYKPKKSSVFTNEQVKKFLMEAPNNEFLAAKVIMIFGVYGALRCQEITNIETTDIKEHGQMFLVSIHETKTKVMGKNLIAKIPQRVAEYLELPNPKTYTGHAFRRTSATLLVDAGADMLTLKRHGVWKSNSTLSKNIWM